MTFIKNIGMMVMLIFLITKPTQKASAQTLDQKIDSVILTVFHDKNAPGGVFLVAHKGKPIYQKAFGKANLELGVNLNTEQVFQLGSMTKQFTAIAVLILEEQGKLKVTDAISKYVPDYPNGDHITIHHLLTHTSGIKDFTRMTTLSSIAQKEMSPKMMVDFFKNEAVDFLPGEKFDYNNSGYVLLGYIIEQASGMDYAGFIQKYIFDKAGMSQSRYADDRKVILNRAYGYQQKTSGYVNKTIISFSVPFASGSLMSTSADLLRWQNALNQNLLLGKAETEKAFTKYKLNNGKIIDYGYGWHLRTINGVSSREHGGSIFGFKTMGVYLPAEDIYVVGLSNCDGHSPTEVTRSIAAKVLEGLR